MKICIDAGHNGSSFDTGAVGIDGVKEQDITFEIASLLESILKENGIETVMTRKSKDENLGTDDADSLRERVRICNDANCDYFVSIHCNSSSPLASGCEVLIPETGGLAQIIGERAVNAVSDSLDMINRGVRVDREYLGYRIYVLHNTNCPAILIETGFITNREDSEKLITRPKDFANAIASVFGAGGENMPNFSDIEDHWAKIHIEKLAEYGVVNGYNDGTFRPDETITRAEVAVMVSNALSVLGK